MTEELASGVACCHRGDLLSALLQLDKEDDVNKVLRYFSYEHFYVIYCKVRMPVIFRRASCACGCRSVWHLSGLEYARLSHREFVLLLLSLRLVLCMLQFWELDTDHDFFICKEDLLRYGNHSLTYRIVDRIFSQVTFQFTLTPDLPLAWKHNAICMLEFLGSQVKRLVNCGCLLSGHEQVSSALMP